ncbi:uncharacterized protein A4U43_C04F18350 [Asparagus officinalis]|uniref:Uncharacterized protein n=1 Tax=Asparagus officinalis TaxID=4686 RepID=A0A5P1F1U9_ASPOF|nr:uncharacterized protein A4U43_C04F18350 [Asparagus officinalis]
MSRGREPQGIIDSAQVDLAEVAKADVLVLSPKEGPPLDIPLPKLAEGKGMKEISQKMTKRDCSYCHSANPCSQV